MFPFAGDLLKVFNATFPHTQSVGSHLPKLLINKPPWEFCLIIILSIPRVFGFTFTQRPIKALLLTTATAVFFIDAACAEIKVTANNTAQSVTNIFFIMYSSS